MNLKGSPHEVTVTGGASANATLHRLALKPFMSYCDVPHRTPHIYTCSAPTADPRSVCRNL